MYRERERDKDRDRDRVRERERKRERERDRQRERQREADIEASSKPDRSNEEVSPKQRDRHEKNGLAPLRSARTGVGQWRRSP